MLNKPKFNFNPFKNGLNQVLGELEKAIMETLWQRGESCVRDILEELPNSGDKPSYSTIITVMNRLSRKGLLEKVKVGRTFYFKPAYTKREFFELVSKKVVEGVLELSPHSAIVHFLDYMTTVDSEKIEELAQVLEKKKRQLISLS